MLRVAKILAFVVIVWSLVGLVCEPAWWYRLIFEGQFAVPGYWGTGLYLAVVKNLYAVAWFVLLVWTILALSRTDAPDRFHRISVSFWANNVLGSRFFKTLGAAALIAAVAIATLEVRSRDEIKMQRMLADITRTSDETLRKLASIRTEEGEPPLAEPTTFFYLDSLEVNSLYGQYEPDLVLAIVREELKTSTEVGATASLDKFLETKAGRSRYESKQVELRQSEKNPQRKTRDLLKYLYDGKKLNRYGHRRWNSEDLRKLEDATILLSKYGVLADPKKLRDVRDRLLAEEMGRLEKELQILHGLVLAEGDWTVEATPEGYRLRTAVVDQISNPLYFSVFLRKQDISQKNQDTVQTLEGRPLRLSTFGNVAAGVSEKVRDVHITPIAVF
jgi:hypothetical protein